MQFLSFNLNFIQPKSKHGFVFPDDLVLSVWTAFKQRFSIGDISHFISINKTSEKTSCTQSFQSFSSFICDPTNNNNHKLVCFTENQLDVCLCGSVCLCVVLLVSRRRRESQILWWRSVRSLCPCWAAARQEAPASERCTGSERSEPQETSHRQEAMGGKNTVY